MTNSNDAGEMNPARDLLQRKETGDVTPPRALDHLALAILLAHGADWDEALAGIAGLRATFVDWNEARVARELELARALGDVPNADSAARRIKEEYNLFFDKRGALAFDFLAAGKPSESKRTLQQQLPLLHKAAVGLLLYEFCPGASFPLTDEGLRQARKDGLVGKNADKNQVARLLADSLELSEAALLIQHWELAASGTPYGEAARKETAAAKKAKKAKAKPKPKAKSTAKK